ncbi:MAG: adenylosuccinate synthase [Clostridiales Family XIII bacterium]|jgi:adenylosuccinate synthase|nr:adenylosuccinate synthase [Clostridiales Family XIII bacterium]
MKAEKGYRTAAIIGLQWGDEGKGKIIDYLAGRADVVVRAQGGNNAGHTVVIGGKKYALHLIPSGVLHPGAVNVIGNGVVVDPEGFFKETATLEADGVDCSNIFISDRAHIVFPWHRELDALIEASAANGGIGTTKRGIGPCYAEKTARTGLRACDMLDARSFREKLAERLDANNTIISKIYGAKPLDSERILDEYAGYAERMSPMVADTGVIVYDAVSEGKAVLFEGAQGVMLDLDLGTYPYVTSSHPGSGGFIVGAGVGPSMIREIVGVVKAYTTRVGAGPMVTELTDETGNAIREAGHEYGTTTGRPRRCGWFDGVAVRHSVRANGVDGIALMLLDVLSGFDEIKLCYAYETPDSGKIEHFPASLDTLAACKPLYRAVRGWRTDISRCTSFEELPKEAQAYIAEIENLSGAPVKIVSVGPGREQTIIRENIL